MANHIGRRHSVSVQRPSGLVSVSIRSAEQASRPSGATTMARTTTTVRATEAVTVGTKCPLPDAAGSSFIAASSSSARKRPAGKIERELDGNGGVNWDAEHRQMADAWLTHVGSGTPLKVAELTEARHLVSEAKARGGEMERFGALAVAWVDRNPDPIPLPTPPYGR